MHEARLDAKTKEVDGVLASFRNSGGTCAGSVVAAARLFVCRSGVSRETCRQEKQTDTHTHTHMRAVCVGTGDDVQPRCVEEPPQLYTMPAERSDSG